MTGAEWRFYGRAEEIKDLRSMLDYPDYSTITVVGGRGVGKSELIRVVCGSVQESKPSVFVELPEFIEGQSQANLAAIVHRVAVTIIRQTNGCGMQSALKDLSPPDPTGNHGAALSFICDALQRLLAAGAVVVLDEFQNAVELGLIAWVKLIIEEFRPICGTKTSGKLVLAGSHQQKMSRIFNDPRQALYERDDASLRLFPLRGPEVLEMAAEQGWLDRPRRFLTAWAVFGGMPRLWKRFHSEQQMSRSRIPEPPDGGDREWQAAFIESEVRRLRSIERERFDNKAHITLGEDARRVALRLSLHPRGMRTAEAGSLFPESGRQDRAARARSALETLIRRLDLAEYTGSPGNGREKVRLRDPRAFFEMCVESLWPELGMGPQLADAEPALEQMRQAEARELERLTAEWLRALPGFKFAQHGITVAGRGREIEIDAVAVGGAWNPPEPPLALCSCKRSYLRHSAARTADEFESFLGSAFDDADIRRPSGIRRILVSPEWPGERRSGDDGFERIGIQDMARSLGFEISPWPMPSPAPEPGQNSPPDGDGYGFSM